MALPVPFIVIDPTIVQRTKFSTTLGLLGAQPVLNLVSTWPEARPPDPPDLVDDPAANDRYEQGDASAVTRVLYRVIERTDDQLTDAERDSINEDTLVREGNWQVLSADVRYRDFIRDVAGNVNGVGSGTVTHMAVCSPSDVLRPLTHCYWVLAVLGAADQDILIGWDDPNVAA